MLDADGASLRFARDAWAGPPGWRTRTQDAGEGRVDDDARGARYAFPWYGEPLDQRTQVAGDALQLTQRASWSHAVVTLRRRA